MGNVFELIATGAMLCAAATFSSVSLTPGSALDRSRPQLYKCVMANDSRPSRAALREWLNKPRRTQTKLANAVGVTQQTISALLLRSVPSRELAQLIEAATGIPSRGWFTRRERAEWEGKLKRARSLRVQQPSAS
jgi:DNA-binding XRE family transcriptional regulator